MKQRNEDRTGRIYGRYRILRTIRQGGGWSVYEAEHATLGDKAAVKVFKNRSDAPDEKMIRFRFAEKTGNRQDRKGVVSIFEATVQDDESFVAEEYVEGITLSDWIKEAANLGFTAPGHYRDVAKLMTGVADAVGNGHSSGVTHCCVTPSRILLDEKGNAWVTDFGFSRIEQALSRAQAGKLDEPVSWLAPEQTKDSPSGVDVRTDIFALGAVLYEMLTLRRAFDGEGAVEIIEKITGPAPQAPRSINAAVPRDLAAIAMKALEKDADLRYQSVAEFDHDLRRYLSGDVLLVDTLEAEPEAKAEPEAPSTLPEGGRTVPPGPHLQFPPPPPPPAETETAPPDRIIRSALPIWIYLFSFVTVLALGAFGWFLYFSEAVMTNDLESSLVKANRDTKQAQEETQKAEDARAGIESRLKVLKKEQSEAAVARNGATTAEKKALAAEKEAKSANQAALESKTALQAALKSITTAEKIATETAKINTILATVLSAFTASAIDGRGPLYALKDAASQTRKFFGDNPEVEVFLRVPIGRAYARLGHYDLAKLHLEEGLKISERLSGSTHPDTLLIRRFLADVLIDQGKPAEAEPLFRQNLKQTRKAFGDRHPTTILAIARLADVLAAGGDLAGAEGLDRELLKTSREVFGEQHPSTLKALRQLAGVLVRKGDHATAEPLQREAVNGLRRVCGKEHPDTLEMVNALALNLIGQKKYDSAETQLLTAYSVLKKLQGERIRETESAVNLLIGLYDAWEKPDKAARWRGILGGLKGE